MYADKITKSMEITIEETARRRTMQIEYNEQHGLVPTALNKSKESILESTTVATTDEQLHTAYYKDKQDTLLAAEPILEYQTKAQLEEKIKQIKSKMLKAAKEMDFLEAARWRDELQKLEQL
jgi:excinuclease ABC subunit B